MLLSIIDCLLIALLPTLFIKRIAKIKKIYLSLMVLFYFSISYYFLYILLYKINFNTLLSISIILCLTFLLYKFLLKNNYHAIYYSVFINYFIIFITLLCLFIVDFFGISPIISVNIFFCFPIIFLAVLTIFYLFKNLHISIIEYLSKKKYIIFLICSFFLVILSFYTDLYKKTIYISSTYSMELIIGLIILLFFYMIFLKNIYNKTIKQNEFINSIIKQQTLEFQKMLENEKEIRQLKHNMKHILLSILDQYENNPYQIKKTVIEHLHYLDNIEKIINTGHSCLDIIISYYMPIIKEKNIDIITNFFQNQSLLKDTNIYIILGNILENAIEHCNAKTKNKIIIYSTIQNNNYYFQIKNTIDPNSKVCLNTSQKKDSGHGYGIESIKKLVKKNNGKVKFYNDSMFFYVELYLPL